MPCACCCSECNSPEPDCCGGEYPRLVGVCCEGVWRVGGGVCCNGTWRTGSGTCCGGVWQTGSGVCCAGVWQTGTGGCCGGVWYSGEGYCCNGTWHSDADPDAPCPEGWTFHRWGDSLECCGCVPPEFFDPELNGGRETTEDVLAALCCPQCGSVTLQNEYGECPGQCCDGDGGCTDTVYSNCTGEGYTWNTACCSLGCPVACCGEDSAGNVGCGITYSTLCLGYTAETCETGCLGECCVDGVSQGQTTQADCFAAGGLWGGLGSTECPGEGDCRSPFSENCCETKQSSGAGLIFIQPYNKRTPAFQGTVRATVTGTTDSPIRVHGVPVGQPGKRCPFTVTFPLCRDRFEIEPIPCGSTFHRVDVTVCWEEVETTTEALNFSACNGLNWSLSDCDKDCATTLVYTGSGATTTANLTLFWDATIQADGSGPLVLTSTITQSGTCDRTLTLSGSSTHLNEIRRISDPAGSNVCNVVKEGIGLWRMNATSKDFNGTLTVKGGTMQVANAAAVGSPVAIGDTAVGASGIAALLLEQSVNTTASFDVGASGGTQAVLIGGANTSGTATFSGGVLRMRRGVTLVAATGGTVEFSNFWAGDTNLSPANQNVTIGAIGYAGTAQIFYPGGLYTSGEVRIAFGSAVSGFSTVISASGGLTLQSNTSLRVTKTSDGIDPSTPVTAFNSTLTVWYDTGDPPSSQSLDELRVLGTLTLDGNGSLTVEDLSGSGGIDNESGTLTINQNSMTGSLSITGGTVIANEPISNPGGLAVSATFTSGSLTVAFSGNPATGAEYVLLDGPTVNTYASVTLTGTTATGTYDSATSTLTID